MKIRVEAASTQPIGAALATWGSVLCKTSAPTSEQQPTPQLCCVAGRSDDGADVLAVLEQLPAPSPGEFVDARTTFKKPSRLSFAAAAQMPLLLLTAASALELAGITGGGTAVVAGSAVDGHSKGDMSGWEAMEDGVKRGRWVWKWAEGG